MQLAKRQAAIARLAVDAGLRSRFFAGPSAVASALRLTPAEAEQLVTEVQDLPRFAHSLVRKRMAAVRQLLPRTAERTGKTFNEEFRRYAESHPSAGPRRHEQDALELARRLRAGLRDETLRTLLYESGWVEANLGRRFVFRSLGPLSFAVWVRMVRKVRYWPFRFGAGARL